MTALLAASDSCFGWMLGEAAGEAPAGLLLPEGGIEDAALLTMLRQMAVEMRASTGSGAWLIVSGSEAVGLISFVKPLDEAGAVEIGYGVAPSRRGLGHATRAVAALVELLRQDNRFCVLTAGTAVANAASERALERAGFAVCGNSVDDEEGEMLMWRLPLR
jgi:RimJ/RimL family protein N-acetyltransferase